MIRLRSILRGLVATGGVAALVVASGCDKDKKPKLVFSHPLHVQDNGMACGDCHGKLQDGRFALAKHEACKDCHGDWIDTKEIKETTCGKCHKVKALQPDLNALEQPSASTSSNQVARVFRHSEGLTNRCVVCHAALMDKKQVTVPMLTRADKLAIRDSAHRSGESCAVCHQDMDTRTPPPSHRMDWTHRHGAYGRQPDAVCSVCHSATSCRECHQVTEPASHNNLWRLQTHGINAAWDRTRCLVCHQEEFCTACHAETAPQSHSAGWRDRHCFQCHTSKERGTGCALCHEGTIETHPNPHPAGWRSSHCTSCHVGSPEAGQCAVCHGSSSHVDPHPAGWIDQHCNNCHPGPESQVCGQCHNGVTSLANHPDPHAVGWRKSHCFSCHPGSASASCTACHPGGNSVLVHQSFWPAVHNRFGDRVTCTYCHEP